MQAIVQQIGNSSARRRAHDAALHRAGSGLPVPGAGSADGDARRAPRAHRGRRRRRAKGHCPGRSQGGRVRRKLRQARAEVFRMREARVKQWNAERDAALDAARKAAGLKVNQAKAELEAEAARARESIQASAGDLACQVVRAVLPMAAGEFPLKVFQRAIASLTPAFLSELSGSPCWRRSSPLDWRRPAGLRRSNQLPLSRQCILSGSRYGQLPGRQACRLRAYRRRDRQQISAVSQRPQAGPVASSERGHHGKPSFWESTSRSSCWPSGFPSSACCPSFSASALKRCATTSSRPAR